jgi:hypothetical protein
MKSKIDDDFFGFFYSISLSSCFQILETQTHKEKKRKFEERIKKLSERKG